MKIKKFFDIILFPVLLIRDALYDMYSVIKQEIIEAACLPRFGEAFLAVIGLLFKYIGIVKYLNR